MSGHIKPGVCPVDGCGRSIHSHRLMCWYHWTKTPAGNRRAVWDAYKAWMVDCLTLAQLRSVQRAAVEACERVLQEGEG